MKYEDLKANGTKILEKDKIAGGGYSGSKEYWECNSIIYMHESNTNTMTYTGKTYTEIICSVDEMDYKTANIYLSNEEDIKIMLDYCEKKRGNK